MSLFLRKRVDSFGNAIRGVSHLVRTEVHAQIHLVCSAVVVACAAAFSISAVEWCLVILAIGLVWAAEAVNTAIEKVVDLASPGKDSIAGQAKDLAAGAVLLAAAAAVAVGLFVFVPRIVLFLQTGAVLPVH
ncbi:MAG: diacylglycerol kinase family protein [Planctomycetaceae bacterium]